MKKAVKTVGIILIAAVIIAAIAVGAILCRTVFVRHPELKGEPENGTGLLRMGQSPPMGANGTGLSGSGQRTRLLYISSAAE
jgi:hypothetical protein